MQKIFEAYNIKIPLPNEAALKGKENPYWGKVWHSAMAMCEYLIKNNNALQNKVVMEVGAGLGLVSLVAARYAGRIISTDVSEKAVKHIKETALLNGINNLAASCFDWHSDKIPVYVDVLLLSDVNYEPSSFTSLEKLIHDCIKNKIKVILATPQRLMAKPFIENIQHLIKSNEELEVTLYEETKYINVINF